ncbi:hypothetical protein [Mangrovicoccus algicola]|uniref:Sugar transporter n=1 Tax=Mangrovicoccus algicola TaxID=2771008 RepID=A0A8J6YZT5_9RHOB|nr:hypothetical protein [Mangrovicoccus algicola]MBE3639006.1 hypothetical protein [Mangrovicoccus algicola]
MNNSRSTEGGSQSEAGPAGREDGEPTPEVIAGKSAPRRAARDGRGEDKGREDDGKGGGGNARPGDRQRRREGDAKAEPGKPGGKGGNRQQQGRGQRQGKGGGAGVPVPVEAHPVPARKPDAKLPGSPKAGGGGAGRQPPLSRVQMGPVPRARMRHRHRYLFYTFLLMVILPAAVVFYYLFEHAQDRYASNTAFFVHREDTTPSVETVFGLSSLGGSSTTPDADVLYQFIQSQRMVELADEALDLRALYSPPHDVDPVFALAPDASLEDLIDYWGRIVTIVYEADSGLINVEVKAFSAEDAQRVAQEILAESAQLINDLSRISEDDAIAESKQDLDLAEERLKTARIALAEFRGSSQFVDPATVVAGQEGVISALESRLAEEMIARDALVGTTTRADDPRLERADRMIQAIRDRISEERANVGSDQAPAVGRYEELLVDRQFAEQAYTAALGAHDAAIAEARRKSRYLAVHIKPTLAASSVYPQRITLGLICTAFLFALWGLCMLIIMSIRDRR